VKVPVRGKQVRPVWTSACDKAGTFDDRRRRNCELTRNRSSRRRHICRLVALGLRSVSELAVSRRCVGAIEAPAIGNGAVPSTVTLSCPRALQIGHALRLAGEEHRDVDGQRERPSWSTPPKLFVTITLYEPTLLDETFGECTTRCWWRCRVGATELPLVRRGAARRASTGEAAAVPAGCPAGRRVAMKRGR